jgi:hypothetical protein
MLAEQLLPDLAETAGDLGLDVDPDLGGFLARHGDDPPPQTARGSAPVSSPIPKQACIRGSRRNVNEI